jgi:hypothetical protein
MSITIEDCLEDLDEINWTPVPYCGSFLEITNTWDRKFISDVAYHTREGKALSTAQGKLALKLIDRYKKHLEIKGMLASELLSFLENPEYRQTPHTSVASPREVRYIGDSKIIFRCKYNAPIVEEIKSLKSYNYFQMNSKPQFNSNHKVWIVIVDNSNVNKVMDIIRRYNFNFDDEITEFFMEVINSKNQKSEVEIIDDQILIRCRDDEFFMFWLNDLLKMDFE